MDGWTGVRIGWRWADKEVSCFMSSFWFMVSGCRGGVFFWFSVRGMGGFGRFEVGVVEGGDKYWGFY